MEKKYIKSRRSDSYSRDSGEIFPKDLTLIAYKAYMTEPYLVFHVGLVDPYNSL